MQKKRVFLDELGEEEEEEEDDDQQKGDHQPLQKKRTFHDQSQVRVNKTSCSDLAHEVVRILWSTPDNMERLLDRHPHTPVFECSDEDYHRFLFRFFLLELTALVVLSLSVYWITYRIHLDEVAQAHVWIAVLTGICFLAILVLWCLGNTKRWSQRSQAILYVVGIAVMIASLSMLMTFGRAELIFHAVLVIGVILTFLTLWTLQTVIRFNFYLAYILSVLIGIFLVFVLVYIPENSAFHGFRSIGNLSAASWHTVWVVVVAVLIMLAILSTLHDQVGRVRKKDYFFVAFFIFFHITAITLLARELTRRWSSWGSGSTKPGPDAILRSGRHDAADAADVL